MPRGDPLLYSLPITLRVWVNPLKVSIRLYCSRLAHVAALTPEAAPALHLPPFCCAELAPQPAAARLPVEFASPR